MDPNIHPVRRLLLTALGEGIPEAGSFIYGTAIQNARLQANEIGIKLTLEAACYDFIFFINQELQFISRFGCFANLTWLTFQGQEPILGVLIAKLDEQKT